MEFIDTKKEVEDVIVDFILHANEMLDFMEREIGHTLRTINEHPKLKEDCTIYLSECESFKIDLKERIRKLNDWKAHN